MKSKKSLYILFPVVLVIWGIVIFRTVAVFNDEPAKIESIAFINKEEINIVKRDTFSLLPLDSDPFLGISYWKPKKKIANLVVSQEKVDWPEIKYLGLVADSDRQAAIHILEVSGNQFLLKRGRTVAEVKIISSKQDRVMLSYKGIRKEFTKNN